MMSTANLHLERLTRPSEYGGLRKYVSLTVSYVQGSTARSTTCPSQKLRQPVVIGASIKPSRTAATTLLFCLRLLQELWTREPPYFTSPPTRSRRISRPLRRHWISTFFFSIRPFFKKKNSTIILDNRTTGLLTITNDQFAQLESLFFQIGSVGPTLFLYQAQATPIAHFFFQETYELTPNAQIWPRQLNSSIGGQDGQIYLIVADLGSNSGQGLDFISK